MFSRVHFFGFLLLLSFAFSFRPLATPIFGQDITPPIPKVTEQPKTPPLPTQDEVFREYRMVRDALPDPAELFTLLAYLAARADSKDQNVMNAEQRALLDKSGKGFWSVALYSQHISGRFQNKDLWDERKVKEIRGLITKMQAHADAMMNAFMALMANPVPDPAKLAEWKKEAQETFAKETK